MQAVTAEQRRALSDEELVRRAKEGDQAAFDVLFRRHRPRLMNHCNRMLKCEPEAEQVTQEVFVRAWLHLPDFQPIEPLEHWLLSIGTNLCLSLLRTKKGMDALGGPRWEDGEPGWDANVLVSTAPDPEKTAVRAVYEAAYAETFLAALHRRALTVKPKWNDLDWRIFFQCVYNDIVIARKAAHHLQEPEGKVNRRLANRIIPAVLAVAAELEELSAE